MWSCPTAYTLSSFLKSNKFTCPCSHLLSLNIRTTEIISRSQQFIVIVNYTGKTYGLVILLDALGTSKRIRDDIDSFLCDWDSVLNRLEHDAKNLELILSKYGFQTGMRINDIFDNIQLFYPTDDPNTQYVDLTGANPLWWTIQHSAELLTALIRYATTRGIYFRGCISMGYIQEYRNGLFSAAMIENSKFAESLDMIGIVAGPSAMWVLNNKSYSSSPRFYRFIKRDALMRNPCINLSYDNLKGLAVLNLTRPSSMFENISDSVFSNIIQFQIEHQIDESIKRKWENTKEFINFAPEISDENLFL